VRVTHDDGAELTFDNIVNDSSLYGSDVLNRIDSFQKIESEYFFLNLKALLFTSVNISAVMYNNLGYLTGRWVTLIKHLMVFCVV